MRPQSLQPGVRRALFAAAAASWLLLLALPKLGWLDFASFYAAGRLAFTPGVTDLNAILGFQAANHLPPVPFLYPPALALAYVPFAWLPYSLAAALHLALQFAALIAAAVVGADLIGLQRRDAVLATVAWGPAATGVITGQNSALLLLLVVASAAGLQRVEQRQATEDAIVRRTGLAIGLASYRPHLGLPLTALAAWRRAGPVFRWALAAIGLQYLLGVVASGLQFDWPAKWLGAVLAETSVDFAAVGWQVVGLPGTLGRLAPGDPALSTMLFSIGIAIGGVAVLYSSRALREWDALSAVALTCALALLASPRGWGYDPTLLLPAVAIYGRVEVQRGHRRRAMAVVCAAYALAAAFPLGALIGFNPTTPVVLLAPAFLLASHPDRLTSHREGRASVGSPTPAPEILS